MRNGRVAGTPCPPPPLHTYPHPVCISPNRACAHARRWQGREGRAAREAPARAPAPAHPTHAPPNPHPTPADGAPQGARPSLANKADTPSADTASATLARTPHPHAFTTQYAHAFTPPPPAIPPHRYARIHAAKSQGIAGNSCEEFEFERPLPASPLRIPPATNPDSFPILGIRIPLTVAHAWTRGPCGSSARGSRGKSKPQSIHRKPGLKKFSGSRAHVGPPLGCLCADLRCRGPRGREASSCA